MLRVQDLSPGQRGILDSQFGVAHGFCPVCAIRLHTAVMWWAHLDVDHAGSPFHVSLSRLLELAADAGSVAGLRYGNA